MRELVAAYMSGWFTRRVRERRMAVLGVQSSFNVLTTPPPRPKGWGGGCWTNFPGDSAAKSILGGASEKFGFSSHPFREVVLSDLETTSSL